MNILDSMLYSYSDDVEKAYIITIKDNNISETLSSRCAATCESVGMKYEKWEAFDGTNSKEIRVPEHLVNQSWLKLLKFTSYKMTVSEIACALSHISLWIHCIELDKPIVILEHDAMLINNYRKHAF